MQPLIDEKACAGLVGCVVSTLQKWRVRGDGPPFVKVGRLVRYRPEDVEAWVAMRSAPQTGIFY